jgi:hypothetical protein
LPGANTFLAPLATASLVDLTKLSATSSANEFSVFLANLGLTKIFLGKTRVGKKFRS